MALTPVPLGLETIAQFAGMVTAKQVERGKIVDDAAQAETRPAGSCHSLLRLQASTGPE